MQQNQARQVAPKSLAENPAVYQYNGVHDDKQQKKEKNKLQKEERKMSVKKVNENQFHSLKCSTFYSSSLLAAELRKAELERRVERKVLK